MFRHTRMIFLLPCLIFLTSSVDADKCSKVGLQCDPEGKKLQFCPKVDVDPEDKKECDEGSICVERNNTVGCLDPQTVPLRFRCTGKGEFPDPRNCSQTYICNEDQEEPVEVCSCPADGYVYPTEGLFCTKDKCPRQAITCTEGAFGHFELVFGEEKVPTSYYYYCLDSDVIAVYGGVEPPVQERIQARIMHRGMANGKECRPFQSDSEHTEPPTTTSTKSDTTITESTTLTSTSSQPTSTPKPTTITESTTLTSTSSQPTSTPEPTTTTVTPQPKCNEIGETFPTECDCDYFKCNNNKELERYSCFEALRYSNHSKRCVFGKCNPEECIHRTRL